MNKVMKAVAALMLSAAVVCAAGCKKDPVGSLNGHEYVDLGLPSGTLWATCNVGTDIPEKYGTISHGARLNPRIIMVGTPTSWELIIIN